MLYQTTTHATLLARLHDGGDAAAWREFSDRYELLIRGFCRRQGVIGAEADDVVQDVMLALTKALPGFRYDPGKGRFRSYLKTVTVRAVFARIRQKSAAASLEAIGEGSTLAPADDQAESMWEAEWRQYHLRQALRTVRGQFSESDVAAFEGYVSQGRDPSEVARELGTGVDKVYQAKSRILKALTVAIARQIEDEG